MRSRSVVCQRRVSAAEEKALDDSACPQPRPPVLEACHGPACPPEWAALDWSEVSRPFPPCAEQGGAWVAHVGCTLRRLPTPASPSEPPGPHRDWSKVSCTVLTSQRTSILPTPCVSGEGGAH